jgi:hypothetical protein
MAAIESQRPSCQRQALASEAVGKQAVVSDAHEALWQHVEEETAQELLCGELHGALLSAMGIPASARFWTMLIQKLYARFKPLNH